MNDNIDYVSRILQKHAVPMLSGDSVAVPHDDEEMNWRLFFAHSQDMQGFRADIFTGGWNEANNSYDNNFRGLRDRWPDSKSMVRGLAEFWNQPQVQEKIRSLTSSKNQSAPGIQPALDLLRGELSNEATRNFADALHDLKGANIARKTRKIIRAYLQNSALLVQHDASFMKYLEDIVPDLTLPSQEIVLAERAWRKAIERDFYNVGPALAHYMIGDWLLWLWRDGQIEWFESYKADSVHIKTLATEGKLPAEAGADFPAYCQELSLPPEWLPKNLWFLSHYPLPPRILNEAIWLEEAATNSPQPSGETQKDEAHTVNVEIGRSPWPIPSLHMADGAFVPDSETDVPPVSTDSITVFVDDDPGYLKWSEINPKGFVVNANRIPVPSFLILHKPACWCVSRPLLNDEMWTAGFIKICSNSLSDLKSWAKQEVNGALRPCGICLPEKEKKQ